MAKPYTLEWHRVGLALFTNTTYRRECLCSWANALITTTLKTHGYICSGHIFWPGASIKTYSSHPTTLSYRRCMPLIAIEATIWLRGAYLFTIGINPTSIMPMRLICRGLKSLSPHTMLRAISSSMRISHWWRPVMSALPMCLFGIPATGHLWRIG